MLADHGAEVIKVEPPQGDETAAVGPAVRRRRHHRYFIGINRNKRTMPWISPSRRAARSCCACSKTPTC